MTADNLDLELDLAEFPPDQRSIYADCIRDALQHKWLESEKARRDLGEMALRDWVAKYWPRFVRHRLMQHLEGQLFWSEFDGRYFGIFKRLQRIDPILAECIADRLRAGAENLCLIVWAEDWGIPMNRVDRILSEINLNLHRLECPLQRRVLSLS